MLDPSERRLTREGAPVDLPPKAFDLLVALARRRGRLATRDDLLAEVWPDAFVDENTLSVHVSKLRAALGESAQAPRYVETVPRAGYRFVAPVRDLPPETVPLAPSSRHAEPSPPVEPAPLAGSPPAAAAPRRTWLLPLAALGLAAALALGLAAWGLRGGEAESRSPTSLAVLPLATLGEGDHELGLALADALITQLGALDGLAVRPTHAVAPFAGSDPSAAGRALRTDAVLDGRLQHADGRVRVTLQLLRTQDGQALWTGTFTADAADRLSLQDALAAQAVRALARELTPEEQERLDRRLPRDVAAHEAYLRGRHAASRRTGADLRRALAAFRDAVAAEPTFAPAYAEMARAYALLVWYDGVPPHVAYPRSRAAAEAARQLDPALPDALLALASAAWLYDGDADRAEALFREATLRGRHLASAHHQLGEFLALTGRLPEGIAHLERARALDPLSPVIAVDAGSAYLFNGQPHEAIRRYRAVLDLEPGFALARVFLTVALLATDDMPGAVAEAERAVADGGRAPLWLATLARAYAAAGRSAEARAALSEAESMAEDRFVSPVALAIGYEGLGDREAATAALARAEAQRDPMRIYLGIHPGLASLRQQ